MSPKARRRRPQARPREDLLTGTESLPQSVRPPITMGRALGVDWNAQEWASVAARWILGVVFCWFAVEELWAPALWTGYVPIVSGSSELAKLMVLGHGELLLVLGGALILGVAPRLAALAGATLLAEIVLSLTVGHGLNDIAIRDLGILGLALVVATGPQRLLLRS